MEADGVAVGEMKLKSEIALPRFINAGPYRIYPVFWAAWGRRDRWAECSEL